MKGTIEIVDGPEIRGFGMGSRGISMGRLELFNGILDPQFVLSDPSTKDMILLSNRPLLGGTGVRRGMDQSDILWAQGLICPEICDFPSYYRYYKNISVLLEDNGKRAVTNIDTDVLINSGMSGKTAWISVGMEKITRKSDFKGNGVLETESPVIEWDDSASVNRPMSYHSVDPEGEILLIDLGIRSGFISYLRKDYDLHICSPDQYSDFNDIQPDGIIFSTGPGDLPPKDLMEKADNIIKSHPGTPIFGSGMGALTICSVKGCKLSPLNRPHIGSSLMVGHHHKATYQIHGWIPLLDEGWVVSEKCAYDDSVEGGFHKDGDLYFTLYDPLPDIRGVSRGEPFTDFLDKLGGGKT